MYSHNYPEAVEAAIELAEYKTCDTSKVKYYNGEYVILPIKQRKRLK